MCTVSEAGQRDAEQELAARAEVLPGEPVTLAQPMQCAGDTGERVRSLSGLDPCGSPMIDAENCCFGGGPAGAAKRLQVIIKLLSCSVEANLPLLLLLASRHLAPTNVTRRQHRLRLYANNISSMIVC